MVSNIVHMGRVLEFSPVLTEKISEQLKSLSTFTTVKFLFSNFN